MEEPKTDNKIQNEYLPGMYPQYTSVRQRNLDKLLLPEKKLNSFHLRCLRSLFEISWMDKVSNEEVLQSASLSTVSALIKQRRLRWLGHVRRMDDGRIPKDLLYGEIAEAKRPVGHPKLRFKDVCTGHASGQLGRHG